MITPIRTDETFDSGIRRIYVTKLHETVNWTCVPDSEIHEAVHNVRKNFKFLRALLRQVKTALGIELYESENYLYRDLGRLVAEVRDLHVRIELIESLTLENEQLRVNGLNRILESLKSSEKAALSYMLETKMGFDIIEKKLLSASNRLHEDWPAIPDTVDALLPGLGEVYAKGRAGYLLAKNSPNEIHFHDWRKQVKYLLYLYEVLSDYWPNEDLNGEELRRLSEYLGEEHDLALFYLSVSGNPSLGTFEGLDSVLRLVEKKRDALQKESLLLGEQIYVRPAPEFCDTLRSSIDNKRQNRNDYVA